MTISWAWAAEIPTTNVRIIVSVSLAVMYVMTVLIGSCFGKFADTSSINTLAMFLLAMMGLDVAQFIGKRFSDSAYVAAKAEAPAPTDLAAQRTVE